MTKNYIFHKEDAVFVGEKVNSPENLAQRKGEALLPFPSLLDPEERIYEQFGYVLQEKDRLRNLRWIQEDLEKILTKWHQFYKENSLGNSRAKGLYTDKNGDFSLECLWNGFLNYSGKKMKYRVRQKKSNKEVLEHQLRIKTDWNKEGGEAFPREKIEKKLLSIQKAVASTRINIAEAETRLDIALALFREKIFNSEEFTEEYQLHQIYDIFVERIKERARKKFTEKRLLDEA